MNIERAGRQQKAYWKASLKQQQEWTADRTPLIPFKEADRYQVVKQRMQGFAAGWIAGVAWAKRNAFVTNSKVRFRR